MPQPTPESYGARISGAFGECFEHSESWRISVQAKAAAGPFQPRRANLAGSAPESNYKCKASTDADDVRKEVPED